MKREKEATSRYDSTAGLPDLRTGSLAAFFCSLCACMSKHKMGEAVKRSYVLLYSALMVYNNFKDCIVGEAMVH